MEDEEMGVVAAETVGANPPQVLTADEERSRNETLRDQVRRVHEQRGCALAELAREAGIPPSTFGAWLAGTYKGRVRTYDDQVERWLRGLEDRRRTTATFRSGPGYTPTPAMQRFFAAFEHAQHAPDLVVVSGAAGVGKTTSINAYQSRVSNVWVITGEPCLSTPRMVLDDVAELLGLSDLRSSHRISRGIVQRLRGTRGLLVVDEAQHLNTATLDQLRTLHDLAGIGVALVGNERVHSRIEGGARTPEFAQLFSRVGMRVMRPKPTKGDIDALLDAWGVDGGEERRLLAGIARKPGALRLMSKVLRIASMQASSAGEALSARFVGMAWEHLAAAKLEPPPPEAHAA